MLAAVCCINEHLAATSVMLIKHFSLLAREGIARLHFSFGNIWHIVRFYSICKVLVKKANLFLFKRNRLF